MAPEYIGIQEEQLRSWQLLERFRRELLPRLKARPASELSASEQDPRRTLLAEDYFSSFLFCIFNPVVTSMRALCHVSHCQKMRQICARPLVQSSFSDAQHVFAPEVLEEVVRSLAQQARGQNHGGDARVRQALGALTAVDGTVLRAVSRMAWAPAAGHGSAIRLHLHFSVFDQIPEDWTITPGNVCERKVLAKKIQPGGMTVADRHYSNDHAFLVKLIAQGSDFVFRLNNNAIMERVSPDRPLSLADREAGVVWDRMVRLGVHGQGPVLRVVCIEANGEIFHLVTQREDLSAELIGLIYRQRWQIELFFKWIKTILNCRHWLAESPEGVEIQIYCVLIASLLLMLWTGQRPTKRMVESLRYYWMGLATEEDLLTLLERARRQKKS